MHKKLQYNRYLSLPVKARLVLVQKALIDKGYSKVSITGKRDRNTVKAIADLQKKNGLSPNCVICEATYDLLEIERSDYHT